MRAFQRAVNEDHVNAVIASYISEVVLALEPWAGRLKTVMITPGAASDVITQNIAKDYEHNKYTFHGYLTSSALAGLVCDAAKDMLVDGLKMKTAVIMSEDAAWTTPLDAGYEKCLPKIGLKVLDHIRFSPDTTDFTPIFNKIEGQKPDVIITGISHVGTQPTVQWKSQQVPIPMFGISSQATNSTFWKDTNGATEGVLYRRLGSGRRGDAEDAAVRRRVHEEVRQRAVLLPATPPMTRSTIIADAIKRAGSTDSDKLVDALEKTDYVGTIGRVQFLRQGRPARARAEDRRGLHHRADAAVAGRQAGQPVAEGARQRQAEVPVLHQGRAPGKLTRSRARRSPERGRCLRSGGSRAMLFWQILIDGFAISSLYALGRDRASP